MLVLFASGALMPTGLALYAMYPDWSLMYLANPAHLPQVVMVPLVIGLYLVAPASGFLLSHRFLLARHDQGVRAILIGTGVALFLVTAVGFSRLTTVAYYDDFHHGGPTISLFGSPLIWALGIMICPVASAFVYSVLQVRAHIDSIKSDVRPIDARQPEFNDTVADSAKP